MKVCFYTIVGVVGLLLISTVGCIKLTFNFDFPFSIHPVVAPDEAAFYPELVGSYRVHSIEELDKVEKEDELFALPAEDPDNGIERDEFMHIGRPDKHFPKGFLRLVTVGISTTQKLELDDSSLLFAQKIGEHYVLNLPMPKSQNDEDFDSEVEPKRATRWNPEDYDGYFLLLAKPVQNGFDVHMVDTDFLKAEIIAGRLGGSAGDEQIGKEDVKPEDQAKKLNSKTENPEPEADENSNDGLVVEEKNEKLLEFFKLNIDKLSGEPIMKLRRIK